MTLYIDIDNIVVFNIWICILEFVLFLTVTISNLFLGEYTGEITFI